ncbi:FkbM family methyltransferase [Nocardia sp. No.11]|uniref:FkbM family methyltransferase n=1 Tax=Nocardia sp. No.11 TaxID=3128861 RepID=UPI00319DE6E7
MVESDSAAWRDTVLVPPPWTPLQVAARWWVRYGPGVAVKRRLLREWLDVGLRQHPRVARTVRTRHGRRFHIPTTLDFVARAIYLHGCWEPVVTAVIASRLRPGDTMIDLGAAGGWHTVPAAHLVGPSGSVVAVEPAPAAQEQLRANLALNRCDNVRVAAVAIAAESAPVRLYVPDRGNAGATTTIRPGSHIAEIVVPGAPLADIVSPRELARARIIKIDVEGAEGIVLTDLAALIPRLRADCEILVELTPRWLAGTGHTVEHLLEPFTGNGFRVYRIPNSYAPQDAPVLLRRPPPLTPSTGALDGQTDLLLSRAGPDPSTMPLRAFRRFRPWRLR